jgi:hypothetical protein
MDEHASDQTPAKPPAAKPENEIAVKASAFLKQAAPKLNRLIVIARPHAKKAGEDAARYVRDHEGEIKQAAGMLARSRMTGPLGLVVGALTSQAGSAPRQPGVACNACSTLNTATARFCSECGARLGVDHA